MAVPSIRWQSITHENDIKIGVKERIERSWNHQDITRGEATAVGTLGNEPELVSYGISCDFRRVIRKF